MRKSSCYTYFSIHGDFEPDKITKILGLEPFNTYRFEDENSAAWQYGKCEEFDYISSNQVSKTIKDLLPKKDLLKKLKKDLDLTYYIEIVPSMYINESHQVLSPSREMIEFCYETGTEIDIDLYLYGEED